MYNYFTKRRRVRNVKIPQITIFFWIIKIMCTTLGETKIDKLIVKHGLINISIVTAIILLIALTIQISIKKYIPLVYWINVLLLSMFTTLVINNLTNKLGIALVYIIITFLIILLINFYMWYKSEETLSIHSICTTKREIYYWMTILLTFILSTALGDFIGEPFNLELLLSTIIFAVALLILGIINYYTKINKLLIFWLAYIISTPFAASFNDVLSKDKIDGGM
jgi:uncharacterized membrane-anchored protein